MMTTDGMNGTNGTHARAENAAGAGGCRSPLLREIEMRHERSRAPPSVVLVSVVRGLDDALLELASSSGGGAAAVLCAATTAVQETLHKVHVRNKTMRRQIEQGPQQQHHAEEETATVQARKDVLVIGALLAVLNSALPRVDWRLQQQHHHRAVRSVYAAVLQVSKTDQVCRDEDGSSAAKALPPLAARLVIVYCDMLAAAAASIQEDVVEQMETECSSLAEILVNMCIDPRPKVRRAASAAAAELRGVTPARAAASALVRASADAVLRSHKTSRSLRGSAGAKAAEAQLAETVLILLHALSALRGFPLVPALCGCAGRLYSLQHPLVSQHLTEALLLSFEAPPPSEATAADQGDDSDALAALIRAVAPADLAEAALEGAAADVDTHLARMRCAEAAFARLATLHKAETTRDTALRALVSTFVPLIGARQEALRFGAAAAVQNVLAAAQLQSAGDACMRSVAASLATLFSLRYRDAWHLALPVVSSFFEACGRSGRGADENLRSLLVRTETLRADDALRGSVDTALGIAVRWLGADFVLEVLPLGLEEGIGSGGAGRAWLLPIVRSHSRSGSIEYWSTSLLPLAKRLRSLCEASSGVRMQLALAAEVQAWSTLPAFCSWARDTAEVFPQIARELGIAVAERPELRNSVCSAVTVILKQNLRVAAAAGDYEDAAEDDEDALSDDGRNATTASPDGEGVDDEVPEYMDAETAERNIESMRSFSRNFLPIFFNAVVATPQGKRQDLTKAIALYSKICDKKLLRGFFRTIIKKLIDASRSNAGEGEDDGGAEAAKQAVLERCTHLDLVLALLNGAAEEDALVAYTTARAMVMSSGAAVPTPVLKRSYRLVVRLMDLHPRAMEERLPDVVEMLLASRDACGTAARRYRLLLVRRVLLVSLGRGGGDAEEAVQAFIGEAVIGVKEHNARTRRLAFEHLVILGRAYEAEGRFEEIFNPVLACLAGATPHMISAGVMALTRLVYEFTHLIADVPKLVGAVMQLMRSRAREVIRSTLGFAKVIAVRLPVDEVEPLLPTIVPALLLWCEDTKNKFKLKVRVILERLVKRCGHDTVARHIPEEHAKLIAHIRKTMGRADRKKRGGGGGDEGDEGDGAGTIAGAPRAMTQANTARRSQWRDDDIFSDDDDGEGDGAASRGRGAATAMTNGGRTNASSRRRRAGGGAGGGVGLPGDSGKSSDPLDLLSGTATRRVLGAQKAANDSRLEALAREEGSIFDRDGTGKIIITKELESKKRRRADGEGDGEDDDGTRSRHTSASQRTRSRAAPTVSQSHGGVSRRSSQSKRSNAKFTSRVHSSDKYRNKKGTGGDRKVAGAPDPYSFWALDRKLLNRRAQKRRGAKEAISGVVNASKKSRADAGSSHKRRKKQ